jgi:acetolactate synthase-1/2/3 large subunit
MNTGDLLAELLLAHGIDVVFGMTGGQGYMLNDALHRRRGRARHVMVRDERSSAHAADGWARVRGRLGVCDAPFGVGMLRSHTAPETCHAMSAMSASGTSWRPAPFRAERNRSPRHVAGGRS